LSAAERRLGPRLIRTAAGSIHTAIFNRLALGVKRRLGPGLIRPAADWIHATIVCGLARGVQR
jgi:hypothetical protein